MERILVLTLITLTIQSCKSQQCENTSEIGFIFNFENEKDRQSICIAYENNRELFFKLKNESENFGFTQIKEIFSKSNISKKAIDQFLEQWHILAKEHRLQTQQRDSIYLEGHLCLQSILDKHFVTFNNFIQNNKEAVISCLTKNQIQTIQQGINDYRSFNEKKKDEFLKEESLYFGQIGKNIIIYNQLSFDVIDKFMTCQYKFGLKGNYTSKLIEMYDNNAALNQIFLKYRSIEEEIVDELTSDKCLKRMGIIRYYDELNDDNKKKAIRVNMLMNMFK